jgi:hypothetical protein
VHGLPLAWLVVVPAAEVEDPVHHVEEDLALERESARACLARGRVRREDDLSQELVPVVVERERDHVGRSRDVHEVDVDPSDRRVVHEGDRERAPGLALGLEHESGQRLEASPPGPEASLLVRDLDHLRLASLTAARIRG